MYGLANEAVDAAAIFGGFAGLEASCNPLAIGVLNAQGCTLAAFFTGVVGVTEGPAATLTKARLTTGRHQGEDAVLGIASGTFVVVEELALFFDRSHANFDTFGELLGSYADFVATTGGARLVAVVGGTTGPCLTDQAVETVGPTQAFVTNAFFALTVFFAFLVVVEVSARLELVTVFAGGSLTFGANLGLAVAVVGAIFVGDAG